MKRLFVLIMFSNLFNMFTCSQTYETMWQQVKNAQRKDQPRTEIQILGRIASRATKEKAYGQLIAASLLQTSVEYKVMPDSLPVRLALLEQQTTQADNEALRAIYSSVLSKIYGNHPDLDEGGKKHLFYAHKALSHPDILAQTKAGDYQPFIEKGIDSQIFGNDLLHVIGLELEKKQLLHDWYVTHGQREAACLLATDLANYNLVKLDSIIATYADLPVCGHTALARYQAMPQTTNAERRECYDFLHKALEKWGNWKEANALRNALTELTAAQFTAQISASVIHSNQQMNILFSDVRNLSSFQVHLIKTKLQGDSKWVSNYKTIEKRDYNLLKNSLVRSSVHTFHASISGKPSYELNSDSLQLPCLSPGVYLLEIEPNDSTIETQRLLFSVSDLRVIWQYQPHKKIRLTVVRADSGLPVSGAIVKYYDMAHENQKGSTLTTDRLGEVIIPEQKDYPTRPCFFVSTAEDKALPLINARGMFNYVRNNKVQKCIRIFTDRSIYRPGQTVHASIMAWTKHETETKALSSKPFTLILRDANGRDVARKEVTSDDFGTATVEFQIPTSGLTGMYSICNEQTYENTFILVEEYKRPTFEVKFDEYKDKYAVGDTITLQGTATTYSGVPVQSAKVCYTIVRRPALWWRWWAMNHDVETIYTDTTCTDDYGHFQTRVPLLLRDNDLGFYNLEVRADVTDAAGESHQGSTSLPIGNKEAAITTDLGKQILADNACSFSLQYRNAAGKAIEGTIRYGFFPTEKDFKQENISHDLTLTAEANVPLCLPELKSGGWTLFAACGNDTLRHDFVVFSLADQSPAVETHDWFYQTSEYFPRDGKPVYIQVGSSNAKQHIVYSVIAGDKVLENGRIDQSNALTLLKFRYKSIYGNGLRLSFAWVHDGVHYEHTTTIERPLPEKDLKLTWKSFRDRLIPGQQEEWTLEVNNPDGTPADATLMATLYDKSLDPLRPHKWNEEIDITFSLPWAKWNGSEFSVWPLGGYSSPKMLSTVPLSFMHFAPDYYHALLWDLENINYYCNEINYMHPLPTELFETDEADAPMSKSAAMGKNRLMDDIDDAKSPRKENPDNVIEQSEKTPIQLRENLQETAFFYPQLRTDAQGMVSLNFRLPESVTTWRFMGLAHDREMRHGMIESDIVAQKNVMIQPNLPRFIRMGDHAVIVARISNTGKGHKTGKAQLLLINPSDESVFYEQQQPFSVEEGKTSSVAFSVSPSSLEGHEGLVVARIIAQGDGFSDGEQHYLPVLSNQQYVTTTLPFTQNVPGVLQLDLSQLFKGKEITHPRVTVEYTNNPSWLLIQALPFVGDADEKNAISLTASVYANALGKYIVEKNPLIKTVFKSWQEENGSDNTLQSQLNKNEELKELVLSETPWVGDAQSESEQRKALASFFDENKMEMILTRATNKLRKLQHSDGSFSWWEGMNGNFYMTMAVTKMLTRLQIMIGENRTRPEILVKAFRYLDNEVTKRVEKLKERERKGEKDILPSDALCDYLYTNALAQRAHTSETDYLVGLLSKASTVLSIYGKANVAIILAQYGFNQKANEYLESMRQYTVYKEEMGRYFDTPRATYSWFDYRIPSQVAAIEALRKLVPKDTLFINEMQRWLLQAKRTQAWGTPINTVDAIWAFANNGEMAQLNNNDSASSLSLDGKEISTSNSAGLGYVCYKESLQSIPQILSVEKYTRGSSWGAVYGQYFQPMSEVQSASAGFAINRELLNRDGTPALAPKVGDRVCVRITIEADRDYDFVTVEDKRAACLEPVIQRSGYRWGYYLEPRDYATRYYFDQMKKGKHVIETEYYVDREGDYLSGTCTVQCAYSSEFSGRTIGTHVVVKK